MVKLNKLFGLGWRLITVGAILFCTSCAHQLEVKNIDLYRNNSLAVSDKNTRIGIVPTTADRHCERVIKGIGEELTKYSAGVVLPYSSENQNDVDVIAKINIIPEYKGSGANFWINWPGFLVWAPAWNGFVYT